MDIGKVKNKQVGCMLQTSLSLKQSRMTDMKLYKIRTKLQIKLLNTNNYKIRDTTSK